MLPATSQHHGTVPGRGTIKKSLVFIRGIWHSNASRSGLVVPIHTRYFVYIGNGWARGRPIISIVLALQRLHESWLHWLRPYGSGDGSPTARRRLRTRCLQSHARQERAAARSGGEGGWLGR